MSLSRSSFPLLLCCLLGLLPGFAHARDDEGAAPAAPEARVVIPAGEYVPIIRSKDDPESVAVSAFQMAEFPVTNAEYLAFVTANPQWRRSKASALFVDTSYLDYWAGDLELGPRAAPDAPVVRVSWFSARAYARWRGGRLPLTAEWERAASAGFTLADRRADRKYEDHVLAWLARPTPRQLPAVQTAPANFYGVHGLEGLVWEWVEDFNTAMVTGESRGDTGLDRDLFCGAGSVGAKDRSDYPGFMRNALRSSLKARYCIGNLGFRCAYNL